jgi:hypothetical protein
MYNDVRAPQVKCVGGYSISTATDPIHAIRSFIVDDVQVLVKLKSDPS